MQGFESAAPTSSYPVDRQQIQAIQDDLAECLGISLFVTSSSSDFITQPSGHVPSCLRTPGQRGNCQVVKKAIETGLMKREDKVFFASCGGARHVLVPIRQEDRLLGMMVGVERGGEREDLACDGGLTLLPPGDVCLRPLDQGQTAAMGSLLCSIASRLIEMDVRSRMVDWRMRELSVINEASVAMTSTLDLRALPDIVVRKAAELAQAEVAFLVMPDERTGDLRLAGSTGLPDAAKDRMRIPIGEGLIGTAAVAGEPVMENDVAVPFFEQQGEEPPAPRRSSMICIPLKAEGKTVGVLGVWRTGRAYGRESLQTIQSLVTHATFAILNARLYDDAQQALQKLNRLFELGTEISTVQSLDEVLKQINRHALEATHGAACNITLIDDDGSIKIRAAMGFPARINKRVIVRPEGLSMQVKRSGQPLAIPDNLNTSYSVNPAIVQIGFKSSLCLPLRAKEKTIGVMWVHYGEARTFLQSDISLLLAFANQAAVAIDNARLREELVQQATRDGKTGLFNHDFCLAHLRSELEKAKTVGAPLSLIMVDIDHFKEYNDTFGHVAGDEALRMVASLILAKTRKTDVVARYGGEEFMILLPNTDAEAALFIADRVRAAIEAASHRLSPSSGQAYLTASFGIASFPRFANTENELIERADKALYRAKALGKNRVTIFSP
ncbi:MAG: diguanylate cyclase [Chloroflexi bacterium]|nr:diguanylate cyclase [Chloroflexota bacterium]